MILKPWCLKLGMSLDPSVRSYSFLSWALGCRWDFSRMKDSMNFCPWWHLNKHSRLEDDEDTSNSHVNKTGSCCRSERATAKALGAIQLPKVLLLQKTSIYCPAVRTRLVSSTPCCKSLWKTREIELIKQDFTKREKHWVAVLGSVHEWNQFWRYF